MTVRGLHNSPEDEHRLFDGPDEDIDEPCARCDTCEHWRDGLCTVRWEETADDWFCPAWEAWRDC